MNEFSIICRILGSLFYRQPEDELLSPLLKMIKEGKLKDSWPLEQDEHLLRLERSVDIKEIQYDYQNLFVGEECQVSPFSKAWTTENLEPEIRSFLNERGMSLPDTPCDHFGLLLLAASWLEDNAEQDEVSAQITLFEQYILPWSDSFLGKVEACSTTLFYRTVAIITREALLAMYEELQENKVIA